jgi:Na+/H+ antiporter NhaD/arsenite permease-like protein
VTLPFWSILPFILTLLSIAIIPLVFGNWWEKNSNKLILSLLMSLPVLVVLIPGGLHLLEESLIDYASFMVLLGALFIISGGIYIKGEFAGTPLVNTVFLAIGAILANLIGTTGASMLLIRPYLRANHRRQRRAHLCVFFIFVVSNIGGLLTPLGDPPLFLGFLRGVPFGWTLSLLPIWLATLVPCSLYLTSTINMSLLERMWKHPEPWPRMSSLDVTWTFNAASTPSFFWA